MYYFGLHEGMGRSPLSMDDKFGDKTAVELLSGLLDQLTADQSTRWAMPSLRNAEDGSDVTPEVPSERGHRAIKLIDWSQPGSLHFSVNVRYGSVDGHDLAIGPTDVDIKGAAPSHPYRVEILLPKSGDQGLLIAEDVDRSCPGLAVAQWIGKQSKTNGGTQPWWRMRAEPLSDDKRLSDLIANSKKAEIRLKRKGKTTTDKRYQTPLTIVAQLDRSDERGKLLDEAKKWLLGDKKAKAESVGILSEIAGVGDLDPDEADVYLTDGKTGQRIKPWQLDDVFIYPTGSDSRTTPDGWKSEILTRLSVLGGNLDFDVEW
ncbi:hypothetical protein [Nocardioides sp.]|uniref:hypothetical protein n=1 Tax=Nocardioides sp. TaxID=35761 RepID=UPI00260913EB|nr:hypothetical protein [Nocardioides sp.]